MISIVKNELIEDSSSVWVLKGHTEFAYSDGFSAEKYLEGVFRAASDLSTTSRELESYIKDWSSEYHLTTKRAQLLSGFKFDKRSKVLEVGCGCGAISRFLGETFDRVISVEGSLTRARLAKLRTRDLSTVSVICAPFQSLEFTEKFDIIFVIGVYEYSASFVNEEDPYDSILRYFSQLLTPDGVVVIAIENQFGLKYFTGASEDHLGTPFKGIEGYRRESAKVRTFGKNELEGMITRYFPKVRFFYPYPDYKVPQCVLTGEFLGSEFAGELVSQMRSRDYSVPSRTLWEESSTVLELSRNQMLEFFSNSFLVVASLGETFSITFDQLAVLYSSGREKQFQTETRIVKDIDGVVKVSKRPRDGRSEIDVGHMKMVATESPWINLPSVHLEVALRAMVKDHSLAEIFSPCIKWLDFLITQSTLRDGIRYIDGKHVDSTWTNAFSAPDGIRIVDREWIYDRDIPLNVLIIRSIYDFLLRTEPISDLATVLGRRRGRTAIMLVAESLSVRLTEKDFGDFIDLEAEMQWSVSGINKAYNRAYWHWFLWDRPSLRFFIQSLRSYRRRKQRALSICSKAWSHFQSFAKR